MDIKKKLIAIFSFFCLSFMYGQVISPVSGIWSNRQLLIVDVPADGNVFYSLNGTDPERSGFAYDGPVLIDLAGEISVNVSIIDSKGNRISRKVSYTVTEGLTPSNKDAAEFVSEIQRKGMIEYLAGETFSIPSSLEYSLGKDSEIFAKGMDLSLNEEMVVSRYLPCVVTDGKGFWRFIIKISPVKSGLFSRKDVPFEIVDWETFSFPDKNFIYKIDDGWWYQPKQKIHLDRSVNHMISWQSVDYSKQNVVKFYNIPPKPEIIKTVGDSGELLVAVNSDNDYKFGLISEDSEACELYDTLQIDTFKGDNFDGKIKAGIFYDSVCQGFMDVTFNIHKRNPQAPMIMSSADGSFSRSSVRVAIASTEKKDVYYAVAGPIILDENYTVQANDVLFDLNSVTYKKNYNAAVILEAKSEGAAAYKVSAYCVDENNNKSKYTEYCVIIDQQNYFVNGTITDPEKIRKANGTIAYPFTHFDQVISLINKSRFVHVRVIGNVEVPSGTSVITSNCQVDGASDAKLIFSPTSNFVVRNSSVSISNCIISLSERRNTTETASLFTVERGVLLLDGVEMAAIFGKSGSVINSDNSVITIKNTGITATAESYSSVLAAVQSKINVSGSRLTTVAGTAVNFSAQGGIFNLSDSTCIVTGVMGRIAELFDTHSTITKNNFVGDLKKSQNNNKPIYTDAKNYSVEYSENNITGF